MVAMVKRASKAGKSYCGSALVAVRTVVTAAHCVLGMSPNEIKVNEYCPSVNL
jgi:secreted trypsin-like serine protease